ncbi:50S ribosomal protein L23 [Desulfotalea psychrophila]|uniref:Large ribosomal subunit protein uL23 n=1 Tax=Desulfotalea psychrophila (strain LSv54 / DSM 12343) TaxID=177439 RepID=RL23_DESPS|nr:50S ribosomal protein L23 [Desulfotalea psychrophila]Q6AP69.1 RecName: Full=Large ribosomal subunit protein uL23; AltName: Full=50S ribosomal protein L23 [Desulfotalea psychrophila LSv54]CAG35855.1 probable 50S ribosomal protein L23 [Desulfotalea psychrophila LSv54]
MKNIYGVLKGPVLTEKAAILQEIDGQVVFKVHPKSNKIEIKRAIELMFDVKVKDVRTASMRGKEKRVGKTVGQTKEWKKAYVSLAEGEINFTDEI